jgi:hypothetical protein
MKIRKSKGDLEIIEAVDRHISKYIGDVAFVFDEKDSPYVHIDVHFVEPTPERNYYTLVTSGMSEQPMPTPDDALDGRFAELMICLPPTWGIGQDQWKKEQNWWPIRLLKDLARYPHEHSTWLYEGHTMAYDEGEPFASNTSMTCALLLRPTVIPDTAGIIHINDERHARLWAVYPIYEEERELAMEGNSMDLALLFAQEGITEILDPKRKNVALFD